MQNTNKTAQDLINESVDNESRYKSLFYPTVFAHEEANSNITKILRLIR